MTQISRNPFRPTRWEHHSKGQPLIWYAGTAEDLIGEKSVFVYGSRGSGKTTLLRGICWEDLTYNTSLRLQRTITDFDHIGLYVRLSDNNMASFREEIWTRVFLQLPAPEYEFHRLFSLLLEAVCLEKLLEAIHLLRLEGAISYTPTFELEFVENILGRFPSIRNFSEGSANNTFTELSIAFKGMSTKIGEMFGRGQIDKLWDLIPSREPYEMLEFVSRKLQSNTSFMAISGNRKPRFIFCFDDCEVLDHSQRKSLNSLVRQSRAPISWVVASVGKSQWAGETFIKSQPLTDADRTIVSLDRRDKSDFKGLCEAVASMRLLFTLPEVKREKVDSDSLTDVFNLNDRLGATTINSMIHKMVDKKSKQVAKDLRAASNNLLQALTSDEEGAALRNVPPYYEAYTLLHWQGGEASFSSTYTKDDVSNIGNFAARFRDKNFKQWLSRKQMGAILQLRVKLSQKKIPVCGQHYVQHLADGSIRDFLEVLADIFDEFVASRKGSAADYERAVSEFAQNKIRIPDQIQTDGIYNASEVFFESISNRTDIDGDLLTRLVSGLGLLTSLLQSSPVDSRALAFSERGIFTFSQSRVGGLEQEQVELSLSALKAAELAGYLRPVEAKKVPRQLRAGSDGSVIAYRLHKRFAPFFDFSFRGAYEPYRIELPELFELCSTSSAGSTLAWAKKVAGVSRQSDDMQISLPFGEGDDLEY